MSATIELDICTPEGKTWLAAIAGSDPKFGFRREFVNAVERSTSKSGKTGTATYIVPDGTYESNEGRRRLGRRYWLVSGGQVSEIDRATAVASLSQQVSNT